MKNNYSVPIFVAIVILLSLFCKWAAASESPYDVCERVASNWDYRSAIYSVDAIESATEHNGIYTCISLAVRHSAEIDIPMYVKITYNLEADAYSVKRWGSF